MGERPIRLGMVGGGRGALIGAVHRMAARLDGRYDLVAGALSSDPETARASAGEIGLDPERAYADFHAMAEAEAGREDGVEAVAIVTPNHLHAAAALPFLERGVAVICDKPMAATVEDAERLSKAVRDSGAPFVLTHVYSAYPMVREMRARIAAGGIGRVRVVQARYAQGWLSAAPPPGNKQASWRDDPARSGAGGTLGDIGTHAFHLARFVTGLELDALAADLSTFVPERRLDDNAHVLLRLGGGARGMIWASQIAAGEENGIELRVHGEGGGLVWRQEAPNALWHLPLDRPAERLTRGGPDTAASAGLARVPAGHPEGFVKAFATLYAEAAPAIRAHRRGERVETGLPGVEDGLEGVAFVEACVRSSARNAAWVAIR